MLKHTYLENSCFNDFIVTPHPNLIKFNIVKKKYLSIYLQRPTGICLDTFSVYPVANGSKRSIAQEKRLVNYGIERFDILIHIFTIYNENYEERRRDSNDLKFAWIFKIRRKEME